MSNQTKSWFVVVNLIASIVSVIIFAVVVDLNLFPGMIATGFLLTVIHIAWVIASFAGLFSMITVNRFVL